MAWLPAHAIFAGMEWQAAAVVLGARPLGESGAVVSLLTEAHGRHAGLAKGGASRAQSAVWQAGNLVEVRWVARLAEQLGALTGELVHPTAALALQDPLALALLASGCGLAEGALPERQAHPESFRGLVSILARLPEGAPQLLADYVRWEATLLAELGYGLDLARCAVTGVETGLAWVSPRTGRAVSAEAGEPWRGRLLALPGFLRDPGAGATAAATAGEALVGLRLTAHFLGRDAFGQHGRPLPPARVLLQDRVAAAV